MTSEEKAKQAVRQIRAAMPAQLDTLVYYIKELQETADESLRYAAEEYILRQNQGKSQLCKELIDTLNT